MGHILVDLDGTSAYYDGDTSKIGKPLKPMEDRIKQWLKDGVEVRIFTARAESPELIPAVKAWTKEHFGQELRVVNYKTFATIAIYDDRAFQVEYNKGTVVTK